MPDPRRYRIQFYLPEDLYNAFIQKVNDDLVSQGIANPYSLIGRELVEWYVSQKHTHKNNAIKARVGLHQVGPIVREIKEKGFMERIQKSELTKIINEKKGYDPRTLKRWWQQLKKEGIIEYESGVKGSEIYRVVWENMPIEWRPKEDGKNG